MANLDDYSPIIAAGNRFFDIYLRKRSLSKTEYRTILDVYCKELSSALNSDYFKETCETVAHWANDPALTKKAKITIRELDEFTRFLIYEEALLKEAGVRDDVARYLIGELAFVRCQIEGGAERMRSIGAVRQSLQAIADQTCAASGDFDRSGPARWFLMTKGQLNFLSASIMFINSVAGWNYVHWAYVSFLGGYALQQKAAQM